MSGVYQSFGELRRVSLELAIESAEDFSTEAVVSRADSFFQFLVKDDPGENSKIPPRNEQGSNFSGGGK